MSIITKSCAFSDFEQYIVSCISSKKCAVIQFDIHGFKTINSVYGVHIGDAILQNIVTSLNDRVNTPIYQVNDIFSYLIPYSSRYEIVQHIIQMDRLLSTYQNIVLRLSWGFYCVPYEEHNVRLILDRAAVARQNAKLCATNNICCYNEELQLHIDRTNLIENKMTSALENKEFVLYLQPKCALATGDIVGAEALIRWITSEGIIQPNDFIPIFETNQFVIKTDRFIWEETCKLLHDWKQKGYKLIPISINVSRCNLLDDAFINYLLFLTEKYDVDKTLIEIEITESYNKKLDDEIFAKLKSKGFTLLMDDFGSGYSSLNTLHTSDFDVIKLDKEFLSNSMNDTRGKKIIQHTLSMMKDIDLEVIAEGVETSDQAEFLHNNGCRVAQGFLYSKPIPVKEFEKFLK